MAEPDYSTEIWKTIPFAADYAVSDHGRVKRLTPSPTSGAGLLCPALDRDGYPTVAIVPLKTKRGQIHVHKIMAWVFMGPPPSPFHMVAHGDSDRANNRLANLRWALPEQNAADAVKIGSFKGENNPSSKLTRAQAQAIHDARKAKVPVRALMAQYGIGESQVYRIEKGHSWRH